MNIKSRVRMIEDAFQPHSNGVAIYANGVGGNYGSTLPVKDTRCQYKCDAYGVVAGSEAEIIETLEQDPRVDNAYVTLNGMIRVNFHNTYRDSPIG